MPTVVIIHAAEDTLPARALAEKLRLAKLTVNLELQGDDLKESIRGANAVVTLWSPRSIDQASLISEAQAAKGKGLIHVRMQNAALPEAFRSDKSIDLTGWRGEDDFQAWRDLAKAVTSKAGVPNIPPPAPKPPSGFFQPGAINPDAVAPTRGGSASQQRSQAPRPASPPRQQQPRSAPASRAVADDAPRKGGNMVMIAIITFVVVVALGAGGYFYLNNQQSAQVAASAWEEVPKNDATAIRAFIAGSPGEFRDEAETALAALEEQSLDAARDADSIEAFEAFLNDFPQSEHALAARGRIAELRAQPAEPTVPPEGAETTTEPVDPDLLPPGAATTTTAPPEGGPVPLNPATPPTTP